MTIKEFFSLKTNRYFWGNLIAMFLVVVIAIFATLKGLDSYTLHGEAIKSFQGGKDSNYNNEEHCYEIAPKVTIGF